MTEIAFGLILLVAVGVGFVIHDAHRKTIASLEGDLGATCAQLLDCERQRDTYRKRNRRQYRLLIDLRRRAKQLEEQLQETRNELVLEQARADINATALRGKLEHEARADLVDPDESCGQVLTFERPAR